MRNTVLSSGIKVSESVTEVIDITLVQETGCTYCFCLPREAELGDLIGSELFSVCSIHPACRGCALKSIRSSLEQTKTSMLHTIGHCILCVPPTASSSSSSSNSYFSSSSLALSSSSSSVSASASVYPPKLNLLSLPSMDCIEQLRLSREDLCSKLIKRRSLSFFDGAKTLLSPLKFNSLLMAIKSAPPETIFGAHSSIYAARKKFMAGISTLINSSDIGYIKRESSSSGSSSGSSSNAVKLGIADEKEKLIQNLSMIVFGNLYASTDSTASASSTSSSSSSSSSFSSSSYSSKKRRRHSAASKSFSDTERSLSPSEVLRLDAAHVKIALPIVLCTYSNCAAHFFEDLIDKTCPHCFRKPIPPCPKCGSPPHAILTCAQNCEELVSIFPNSVKCSHPTCQALMHHARGDGCHFLTCPVCSTVSFAPLYNGHPHTKCPHH